MVRHARMRGHPTLLLPGLDHASIAAQFVLDGILAREGESRESPRARALPRADARSSSTTTREVMLGQQRRVGASFDWGRLRYTMDDGSAQGRPRRASSACTTTDLAYRTEALVNWCPGCRTSVSDLEVIPHARDGHALDGPLPPVDAATGEPDPARHDRVATTRPETILGDTAVAVHPDDERYARSSGERVRIPFVERDVPIIADDVVDRGVRHRRGQDHAGARPRRPPDRAAARAADATILADDATITDDRRRATTGSTATTPARRSWPTSRRAATSSGRSRTRWSSGAASAATTSSSRGSRRSGSCGPGRSRRARWSRRDRAGRGSCPNGSRRPGSTG